MCPGTTPKFKAGTFYMQIYGFLEARVHIRVFSTRMFPSGNLISTSPLASFANILDQSCGISLNSVHTHCSGYFTSI
jgi:hypothetical protein